MRAVPEQYLVISIQRDQQVLELVVLEIPDRLLLLVWVGPDGDAVVLPLLRAAVLVHVGDLRYIPNSDAAFDTRSEEQVLAGGLTVSVKDAS